MITLRAQRGPLTLLKRIPPTKVGMILTVRTPPMLTTYVLKVNSLKVP